MAELTLSLNVSKIDLALSSAGSGANYFYQLKDVNTPNSTSLLSNVVTAILSTSTLTLSSTTGLTAGSVIASSVAALSGQIITTIAGNNVTVADTSQWGSVGIVTINKVYLWSLPVDNTVSVYNLVSQKWINSTAQFVSSNTNVGIGNSTLLNTPSSANNNVALGNNTLKSLTTGNTHLALGNNAGSALVTSTNNTIVGGYTGNSSVLDIRLSGTYGTTASLVLSFATGTTNAASSSLTLTFGTVATSFFPISVTTAPIAGGSNTATVIAAVVAALTANSIITAAWAIGSTATTIIFTQATPVVVGFPIAFGSSWSLAPASGLTITAASTEAQVNSTNGNTVISDTTGTIKALITANGRLGLGTVLPTANLHVVGSTRIAQAWEQVNTIATPLSGAFTYDITNGAVVLFTSNASGNFNFNVTSGAASLNSVLPVGHSLTLTFITSQGATAYFHNSPFQIDGVAASVFKWTGSSAPSAGNANGFDCYTFAIVKTAPGVYTVIGSLTQAGG